MATLFSLLIIAMETLLQDPTPPPYVPPPEPAALSTATLDSVRALAQREVYHGQACTVAPSDETTGPYRRVGTFVADQKPTIPPEQRSRQVYVGPDPQPAAGPDVIILGHPMQRRQLRALIDETRFPASNAAIARLIAKTDGAARDVRDPYSGWNRSMPERYQKLLALPRIEGAPGARRFVFDTNGHHHSPVRVMAQVDGEGGLELVVTPLEAALAPGMVSPAPVVTPPEPKPAAAVTPVVRPVSTLGNKP